MCWTRSLALFFSCALASLCIGESATADIRGVAVQVNEGKPMPTPTQLAAMLNPGDFVYDVLGWHKVDKKCDLRDNPTRPITLPAAAVQLYSLVQNAGGKNFVVLAFNNKKCGQPVNAGGKTFPNTPLLRAEFAAYAARVAMQVPALGGVALWSEFTGTQKGGYAASARAQKLTDYCLLANAVIPAVRQVSPDLPIAIGATVGWNIADYFSDLFQTYGCMGQNDPTIWLDVHPYLATQSDWNNWNNNVRQIRARGIANALIASEWGGAAAVNWYDAHPGGDYIATFEANVFQQDAGWAGGMWFLLKAARQFPNQGLFDQPGTSLTHFGEDYIRAYRSQ